MSWRSAEHHQEASPKAMVSAGCWGLGLGGSGSSPGLNDGDPGQLGRDGSKRRSVDGHVLLGAWS